jgi:uncharacterized protein YydD (DUF2326 family)
LIIDRKIQKIEEEKNFLNINPLYIEQINELNGIKLNINKNSSEISRLEIQIDLIKESEKELQEEKLDIDINKIRLLYTKANSFIKNIQKSFEEVYSFHNNMIKERLIFITEELPSLELKFSKLNIELKNLLLKESEISEKLKKKGVMENQEQLITELTKLYEQK